MARGLWLPSPPARRIITLGPQGLSAPSPADPLYNGIYTDAWWQTIRRVHAPLCLYVGTEERYTDAAKTIVANPGDLVLRHGDLSGFGLDAIQLAAGNRPTATAAGLVYNGAASWMDLTGLASASNSYTIVGVVSPDTVAGTQTLLGANAAAESFSHCVAGNVALHDGAASRVGMMSTARKQLLVVQANAATGLVDFYRDGYLLGSAVYDNTFAWGANPVLGAAYGAAAGFFDGLMEFFSVIPTALSAADLATLHSVLAARFGIAFSPLSVASLEFWYTIAAAYMTLAGNDVSQLTDRSGLARHLLKPGGANRPVWNAADASIDFDSANTEALQCATWARAAGCTNIGSVLAGSTVNHTVWDGTTLNSGRMYLTAGPRFTLYSGANLIHPTGNPAVWARVCAYYDSAAVSSIQVDNGAATTGNAGTNAPGGLTVGAVGNLVAWSNTRVRRQLMGYSRALSALERTALDALNQVPA